MKLSLIVSLYAVLTPWLFAEGEAFQLGSKCPTLKPGTVLIKTTKASSDDVKATYTMGAKSVTGTGMNESKQVIRFEQLEDGSGQLTITESTSAASMEIDGALQPPKAHISPLVDVPLEATWKDDAWILKIDEKYKPSDEQVNEVGRVQNEMNTEYWIYSKEKRSVGDSWKGDAELVKSLSGLDSEIKGEITITFTKMIEHQGFQCAVLDSKFDLSGLSAAGYSMKMKGEMKSFYSIQHQMDLKRDFSAEAEMKGMQGNVAVTMINPMEVSTVVLLETQEKAAGSEK